MGTAESKGKKDMSLKIKSAEEILQQYFEDDNYVISCGMALSNAAIIRAMEEYAAQFKPTAEANANTVLGEVRSDEELPRGHLNYQHLSCGSNICKCGKAMPMYSLCDDECYDCRLKSGNRVYR